MIMREVQGVPRQKYTGGYSKRNAYYVVEAHKTITGVLMVDLGSRSQNVNLRTNLMNFNGRYREFVRATLREGLLYIQAKKGVGLPKQFYELAEEYKNEVGEEKEVSK